MNTGDSVSLRPYLVSRDLEVGRNIFDVDLRESTRGSAAGTILRDMSGVGEPSVFIRADPW
jgi:hypothetical protein